MIGDKESALKKIKKIYLYVGNINSKNFNIKFIKCKSMSNYTIRRHLIKYLIHMKQL